MTSNSAETAEICRYYDGRAAVFLVRCDDCKGGPIRGFRTKSTFAFFSEFPRVAVTAGINPQGWTRRMWRRLAVFIRDSGWEPASHSLTHPWLTKIGAAQLQRELTESREIILRNLGAVGLEMGGLSTFIYPFGDYGTREIEALRDASYALGLSFRTHEGLTAVPDESDWYEWGYTLNAPEFHAADELWNRFQAIRAREGVFSVTIHPPPVRPDKRLRMPNVYLRKGPWARFLSRAVDEPGVWFTSYSTLAAYHRQVRTASLRTEASGRLRVAFERAPAPLPLCPLTVAFDAGRTVTRVALNGRPLPRLATRSDLPREGWHVAGDRTVVSVTESGLLEYGDDA